MDEGAGDEDVDDGEGVGDYAGEVSSCSSYVYEAKGSLT